MDQRALWLSSAFAAARLAMALWGAQLALRMLDRRRATLGWQVALAALAMVTSWWALPMTGVQSWWRAAWLINGLLSAAALIDCVRRWMTSSYGELERWRVHSLFAWTGLAVSSVATIAAQTTLLPPDWLPRTAAALNSLSCAVLLGIAIAVSLELTLGALGTGLLCLRWRNVARWASLAWAVQLSVDAFIILNGRATDTPLETATPFLFAFGMMIVGYIAWCIPRQMVQLAARGAVQGQASLAISGWLAVICLSLASALPPAWPWSQLGKSSAGASALAIVE